jgi:acyl-CoA thioesterase FadM
MRASRANAGVTRGRSIAAGKQPALPPLSQTRRRRADAATAAPAADGPAGSPAATAAPPSAARWAYTSAPQRVRDYELDVFSVVNNGVYASLFQDARHLALEQLTGTSVTSYLGRGVLMALSELVLRYRRPLRSGDWYVSRVGVAEVRGTRVTLSQQVVRVGVSPGGGGGGGGGEPVGQEEEEEEEVAAEGTATVVFLDKGYRPARMPAEAKRAFEQAMFVDAGGG